MMLNKFSIFIVTALAIGCGSSTSKKVSASAVQTANISSPDFLGDYELSSPEFGSKTMVSVENNVRHMKTNGLPNHSTGTFPNAGNPNTISTQNLSYKFPVKPVFSGESRWAREPGVALNGVKFEPETAERFVCETGEVYKIEAFQELVDLGLDFNNAHVQPTGAYHYHGVPKGLIEVLDQGEDIILVGFAHDGFPIYYSKSGKYKPSYQLAIASRTGDVCSYTNPKTTIHKELNGTSPDGTFVSDWVYVDGLGELDECNGTELNGTYAYFVTDEYPYMGRCLKGEFTESRPKGPPPGAHRHGPPPSRGH